jgi:YVTN family beta-propeller protein
MLNLKRCRNIGVALSVALLSLGLFVLTVGAVTKTPPYVIGIESTGQYTRPTLVGVDAETGFAYVLGNQGNVWVFSGTEIIHSATVAPPADIAIDPGQYVYITSESGANPLRVLDAHSHAISKVYIGSTSNPKKSSAGTVLTSTHRAYVVLPEHDAVAVLSGTTLITDAIGVGQQPVDIAADPRTGYVYVVNQQDETVSVLQDTSVIDTVDVGITPVAVDVDPSSGLAYVLNSEDDTVTIIDSNANFATTSLDVGKEPTALAVNPRLGRVYVANAGSTSLSVLAGTSHSDDVSLGDAPKALDVNPATGYIYVVGGTDVSGTITVLSSSLASETYVPVGHSPQDVGVLPVEDGDWAYAAMYKGTGGDDEGRVVILGRTEAARAVIPDDDDPPVQITCQGSGGDVDIEVPPQDVADDVQIDLLCTAWAPDTEPRYLFADQGFLLKAYLKGEHQPGFAFNPPLSADIAYPPPVDLEEGDLELRVGVPRRYWETSGITVTSPPAQNSLSVELSHLPEDSLAGYAVVFPRTFAYLPLITRNY